MNLQQPAHSLIQKYLDGIATPADMTQLEQLLAWDTRIADAFAEATRTEACLEEHFTDRRHLHKVEAIIGALASEEAAVAEGNATTLAFRKVVWRWVAAAVLLVCTGLGLVHLMSRTEAPPHTVIAGRVLVNGVEGGRIGEGAEVEVVGDQSAIIRFSDGSRAELTPSSKAVIRGSRRRAGAVVELTRGGGEFQVEHGNGNFRVETPVGKVTAHGTEFSVGLRPGGGEDDKTLSRKVAMALIVAVMAGNVEVQYGNNTYALGIGENRVYDADKPAPPRKADVQGKVVTVAADGKSITLELPPVKKAAPVQRTIQLTEQTKLSYVNVPLSGEKPTVGYQASVWLAEGGDDTAAAINFGGKKAGSSPPDLAGRIVAVSADGQAITLQLPAKKKGEPAPTTVIQLGKQAKLSYVLVPFDGERPTVGYHANVWLSADTRDTAAAVTFSGKAVGGAQPNLVGRVTALSADGQEMTLQLPSKKKGEPASSATVKITAKTKMAYPNIDRDRQQPTVGFAASVWLEKGSSDQAAGIKFGDPAAKKGDGAKPPVPKAGDSAKGPGPKPGDNLGGFFGLPKGIELTAEQQVQFGEILKELGPAYKKLQQRRNTVLSGEQQAALGMARKAVKEAGLTDPRLVQEALDAAAGITAEQKEQMRALAEEEKALRRQVLDKLSTILTEEQKAKLPRPKGDGKTKS